MRKFGASEDFLITAQENMLSCRLDTGITYSNFLFRTTIMVIGKASSEREFFNSFIHEQRHLQDDLANMNGISLDGEEIAYLSGEIAMKVFDYVKLFICDCDYRKYRKYEYKESKKGNERKHAHK